jgi:hypothetical protein
MQLRAAVASTLFTSDPALGRWRTPARRLAASAGAALLALAGVAAPAEADHDMPAPAASPSASVTAGPAASPGATGPGGSALPELRAFDPCFKGKLSVGNTVTAVLGPIERLTAGAHIEYQWLRDGEPIPGATSKSYVLAEDDAGASVAVQITASKPGYTTEVKVSCTRKISAKPEAVRPRSVRLSGRARVGSTIRVVGPSWGDDVRMQYRWTCDHETIKVTSTPRLTLTEDEAGCLMAVAVRGYARGKASAVRVTDHPEVEGLTLSLTPAAIGTVTDDGVMAATTVKAGTTLKALLVPTQAYPEFEVTWQWLRDGVPLPDQTADTYVVAWSDAGGTVSAEATATAKGYEAATATTPVIEVAEVVHPVPPPETRRPKLPSTPSPSTSP